MDIPAGYDRTKHWLEKTESGELVIASLKMGLPFSPGSVVMVASGGPVMTVVGSDVSTVPPETKVCWFDATLREVRDGSIPTVALRMATNADRIRKD